MYELNLGVDTAWRHTIMLHRSELDDVTGFSCSSCYSGHNHVFELISNKDCEKAKLQILQFKS